MHHDRINSHLNREDIFIRMSLIRSDYSKWRVYMTPFYSDQVFLPITWVHVNAATVSESGNDVSSIS